MKDVFLILPLYFPTWCMQDNFISWQQLEGSEVNIYLTHVEDRAFHQGRKDVRDLSYTGGHP